MLAAASMYKQAAWFSSAQWELTYYVVRYLAAQIWAHLGQEALQEPR